MLAIIGSALWLGIMTSVSPCPLASNIAAMGFIGRRTSNPRGALWVGLLYTAGRALAYATLGVVLVQGLLAMTETSNWLQENMIRLVGPVLIVSGLVLLEWLSFGTSGGPFTDWVQKKAEVMGLGAAFFLGAMFAMAFCPISAFLFFGSLLPLCLQAGSGFYLPLIYGVGTALPVLGFGLILAFAAGRISQVYNKVTQVERWARRITGVLFLVIGLYFTLVYSLRVISLN